MLPVKKIEIELEISYPPGKIENRFGWDEFCKKASELLHIPENYLNPITKAKVEKKKIEEVSMKNSKDSSVNIKNANGNGINNKMKSFAENKNVNKPKQKGLIKGVTNLLGYDSPTEMFVDAGIKILTPTVKAAGRKIANKMFGGGSDSVESLINNQGNEKTYNDTIEIKNSTIKRVNTNNSTHASPREHKVKGHGQRYNTREGPIWKEKEPFIRGKKDESI